MTAHGYKVSLWGDKNVLEQDNDDGSTTLQIDYKPLNYTL